MRVIITTGPSYEPIDQVRRLTNFSTGELGVMLANTFAAEGHSVTCLRGVSATCRVSCAGATELPFTTNDDLLAQLIQLGRSAAVDAAVDAVFHVAALCDFKVAGVDNSKGESIAAAKIESRVDSLTLRLVPARKLIGEPAPGRSSLEYTDWRARWKAYELAKTARTRACSTRERPRPKRAVGGKSVGLSNDAKNPARTRACSTARHGASLGSKSTHRSGFLHAGWRGDVLVERPLRTKCWRSRPVPARPAGKHRQPSAFSAG